ncbi:DUF5133 domain-containing protein [Streptomyces sp. NPDC048392]
MEDVTYTLCVTTGTRHIDAALLTARPDAWSEDNPSGYDG